MQKKEKKKKESKKQQKKETTPKQKSPSLAMQVWKSKCFLITPGKGKGFA